LNYYFFESINIEQMSKITKTKESLRTHKLAPSKKFGQNFLVNENTAKRIVHAGQVKPEDTIIEVGVGLGALTTPLAKQVHHVIGIEIDSGIIRYHEQECDLPENMTLIHQDILKTDFKALYNRIGSKLKFMANLPYSISNPFLFKLIDNHHLIEWATIMLQKEVADRLMAYPGVKQYGIPTVLLRSCSIVEKLMTLKPAEFHPRPKIDSVVVRIVFSPPAPHLKNLPEYNYEILQTIVRASFGQRRKTLFNTLSSCRIFSEFLHDKNDIRSATRESITNAGIQPEIRGESLNLEQFVSLAISFENTLNLMQMNKG